MVFHRLPTLGCVSLVRHDKWITSGYGAHMRDMTGGTNAAFARLLHDARIAKGLRQEDVWGSCSVSRATYGRWERGEIDSPDPRDVREVCLFLGIDPRLAAVALGLVTMEEMSRPLDGTDSDIATGEYMAVAEAKRTVSDPTVPEAQRKALNHAVEAALNLWKSAVAMPEPKEPAGADLARRTTR